MGIDDGYSLSRKVGILTIDGTNTTPFDSCPWCGKIRCIERAESGEARRPRELYVLPEKARARKKRKAGGPKKFV
jgi:hypothetical protein